MEEKFKIKPLTKEQLIVSLDRLTRFKPTEEKYLRVFKELILSNLIYPKYKKSDLDLMEYEKLTELAEKIFNLSISTNHPELVSGSYQHAIEKSFQINKKLLDYEKSVFKFDKNVEKLLNNKINYISALDLIDSGIVIPPYNNMQRLDIKQKYIYPPCNLKWLKSLAEDTDQIKNRTNLGLKFPLEKIILVEGITEEILLPKFAKIFGFDFEKEGIYLISAGGKNQVVKLFYQFSNILKLPIFVLLDSDAKENYEEIKPKLRKKDKVYVIKKGEFEDILSLLLIKKTISQNFNEYFSISIKELKSNWPMTKILEELFKTYGLEFKKAEFAAFVGKNIKDEKDISEEIKDIIKSLSE